MSAVAAHIHPLHEQLVDLDGVDAVTAPRIAGDAEVAQGDTPQLLPGRNLIAERVIDHQGASACLVGVHDVCGRTLTLEQEVSLSDA